MGCDAIIAAPEASAYECDDSACSCEGVGDCSKMVLRGACSDTLIVCAEKCCACEF